MFMKTARSRFLAATLALGGFGLAAPAMAVAVPLGPDAGLHRGHDGLVAVQYGHHGWGHRHGPRWHHRHHHGHHYGWRHHGPRWGHHHHHRDHWGHHRHHHGHW